MSVISKARCEFSRATSYFRGIEGEHRLQGVILGTLIAIAIGFPVYASLTSPQPAQDFNAASAAHLSVKAPEQKAFMSPARRHP